MKNIYSDLFTGAIDCNKLPCSENNVDTPNLWNHYENLSPEDDEYDVHSLYADDDDLPLAGTQIPEDLTIVIMPIKQESHVDEFMREIYFEEMNHISEHGDIWSICPSGVSVV